MNKKNINELKLANPRFASILTNMEKAVNVMEMHPWVKSNDPSLFLLSGLPRERFNYCKSMIDDPMRYYDDCVKNWCDNGINKDGYRSYGVAPDDVSYKGTRIYLYGHNYTQKEIEYYIQFNLSKEEQKIYL